MSPESLTSENKISLKPLQSILGSDVEAEIGKGKTGDISIAFNDLKAYDRNRLTHIYTVVSL